MKKKLMAMGKGDLLYKITGSKGPGGNIVNEENQIKQALENLEKEKEDFKKSREEEIQKVKEQRNLAEEEKQKLIDQLNKEVEENKRQKDESKRLFNEYQKKKKAVLKGEENEKIVKKQEIELSKQREELEIKKRAEERLKEELEERSKANIELKKKYDSKQSHIDDLNKKIAELKNQIEQVKKQNKENEKMYQEYEANFNEEISNFNVENKRYDFILEKFVPAEEREKIEKVLDYNEEENNYKLNVKAAYLQNYKENFPKLKQMQKGKLINNSKIPAIVEDPISLKLEEPDYFCEEALTEKSKDVFMQITDEIKKIKSDDDSDLVYYNEKLEMIVSGVDAEVLGLDAIKKTAKKNK
ncbi:MAG: hypothetical protein MJ252_01020 [archaeon]|nr:hypothetical protein [archaeon]